MEDGENKAGGASAAGANRLKPISKKGAAWGRFSSRVFAHIEAYVVKQYGDLPDPMLEKMTIADMKHDCDRYLGRLESNARGLEETKRDMIKVAHYASLILMKIEEEL